MPLWTPYSEDFPLDLTKKNEDLLAKSINRENFKEKDLYLPSPLQDRLATDYGNIPHTLGAMSYQWSPITRNSSNLMGKEAYSPTNLYKPRRIAVPTLSPPESIPELKFKAEDEDSLSDDPDFQAFEKQAMQVMAEKNGGSLLGNNPRMRRSVHTSQKADDAYRKQRERNNVAAKQSRDRRKLREIHLGLKVAYLQKELASLKSQLDVRECVRCGQQCIC